MEYKKIIITFVALGVVLWIFWVAGPYSASVKTLKETVGTSFIPETAVLEIETQVGRTVVQGIEPVSIAGHSELGNYLTDAFGKTLYVTTRKECRDECLLRWPPYVAPALIGSTGKLGAAANEDARVLQYTWGGSFLYYFVDDKQAGDTKGHGVGGVWSVAKE